MKVENIADIYQLSPMQQGILFHILYAPNSELYFLHLSCTIKGDLDIIAFEQAWQRIVERHAILRTSFHWQDLEKPLQIVNRQVHVSLEKLDWRGISPSVQQQQLEAFLLADRQQNFDLTKAPLMRLFLIQLTDDTYQFVWSKSHLILDGWSRALVLKEVLDIYKALRRGQDLYLVPSRTYGDYIEWLQQQDLSQAEAFWRQMLGDVEAPTSLGVDNSVSVEKENYAQQQVKLSASTTIALQTFARQNQLTLNTIVQGAWAVLLSRYSNQEDVVFGVTSAGRPLGLGEVETMVGLFINTLPTRVRFGSMECILPWLKQLQTQQAEVSQYEYTPLIQVQEWSNIPRSQPLFESILVFENYPIDASLEDWGGLKIYDIQTFEKTNYPLTAIAVPGAELELKLLYDCHRFDAETISRMLGHWQTLLGGMIDQTKQTIAELPLLTATEQNQILHDWHPIPEDYQPQHCIHQLFEAQVQKTPDAVALVYENQKLTYRELNTQANQLAHHLQKLGVATEALVGICCHRSLEMIICILGILKAGAGYVPLDPAYPEERLAFITQDAQLQVIVSEKQVGEKLAAPDIKLVYLDGDRELIAQNSTENPQSYVTPASLAYIIYTSGSTGKPKGVFINHSNVVRLFAATQTWFEFQPQDVWTLFHSIAFDFSVWEIWGALLYGGRLVVVPYEVSRSPAAFYELLRRQQVTVLNQTPSAFRQLMYVDGSLASDEKLPHLRVVIFGGEALDLPSLRPWFERYGDQHPQLVNMYGITETTVHVTYRRLQLSDLSTAQGSVIGRPIRDLQVYVLDQHQQLLPIGVAGEMYVGGAGLARGYLNRPELTAQKFIVNPFAPQRRLYRSGDLARYLPNGDLEYLGRIDDQVKIRGFRIELSEIVAVLNQHPNVRESVVLAGSDATNNKRLVAYFVPKSQLAPTTSALQIWLKEQLPDYMVPSVFVSLPTLPLTTNGKVDRRALPAPNTSRPELDKAFVPPQSLEEQVLANIWAEALHLDSVGIKDNFFELGGDSIRSIQVQSKAQEQGINFSLPELFQYQTIHELLRNIATIKGGIEVKEPVQPFSLISLSERSQLPDDIEDAYPLSKLQAGMLFESEFSQENTPYHNVTSLHLKASLDLEKLQTAIAQLAEHHPILRTSFDLSNFSQPLQLVHRQVAIPLEVADLPHLSPVQQQQELATWWSAQKLHKFDWTKAPLLRFYIHRRSEQTFEFSFTSHHAILDGWSEAVMLTELFENYFSVLGAKPYSPPAIAFRDFVALEQAALVSQECQQYWTEKLDNNTVTILPRWSAASGKSSVQKVCHQDVAIAPELSQGLKQLAKSARVPLKTVLLTAHLRVLNLLSGQSDIVTGLVTNGRPEQKDGERILGLFLNTLPLRLQLNGGTWQELIQEVFQAERESLDFRRYPLAQLQHNCGGQPLFETAFNFVNFHIYQSLQEMEVKLLSEKFLRETNFPLSTDFSLDPFSSQVNLVLGYDATEFSQEQIQAIGSYYTNALAGMVREPSARYELQPLLSAEEKQQLLVEWNQTPNAEEIFKTSCDVCIHQLIENQVKQTPDAVAVVFANQQLTYHELNCRANQLAHYLQELGVKPEALVGICVERSLDMVVGILGILKAGGAYLPLDPAHPPERLTYILGDAQVSILLTQQKLAATLPTTAAQTICLDTGTESITQYSQNNPLKQATANNLAYLIYTSGSTGKPKGVQVPHRGVVNFLNSLLVSVAMTQQDVLLSVTTITFDIAALELFLPLIVGARTVVVSREVASDGVKLAASIAQYRTTFMQATPATWRMLLAARWQGNKQLKILCGGEALPAELANELQQRCACLWNVYGPTETTIWSTIYQVNQIGDRFTNIPIGRPIANTQTYILDNNLQPVPVGVIGELYIGGDGVTKGYLNRPELTKERFITNPFSDLPEARLYKTGDLARYCADGNIEFQGRSDYQVKIRGFRIELGEIEAVVLQHPDISAAVVIAWKDELDVQRLIGYVVPHQKSPDLVHQLQQFLKQKLPEYMIPATFVMLEALPLTPNNKVDRQALPAPNKIQPEAELNFLPPETVAEQQLADIWTQVLNLEKVGVNQNFFELGGDSIRSIQVRSKAQEKNINFSLPQLFQYQTIRELVKNVISIESSTELIAPTQPFSLISPEDLSKMPESVEDAYPLSQLQTGMFFESEFSQEQGQAKYHNITTLHLKGLLNLEKLQIAVQQLAERHPILRTSFHLNNFSQPLQLVHRQVTIPLQIADLRHLSPNEQQQELAAWLEVEQRHKFDWEKAPLLRLQIHRRSEETFQFSFTEHHAILDGWSIALMLTELFTEYFSLLNNEVSGIESQRAMGYAPPEAIAFRDFIAKEQQALASKECQQYWQEKLYDNTVTLLPRWPASPVNKSVKQVCQQDVTISPELSDGLKQLAKSTGVPFKSVLLAAHLRVLNLLSGQSDIVTGLVTNGRPEQKDGDRILGLFLNTLPLRLHLHGGTWLDLIQEVFKVERELLDFRWYPLAQVQQNFGGQSLFEVAFNFVNFHVYQGLQNQDNVELLSEKSFQETNFPLFTDFSLNAFSSQVNLVLEYDATEFSQEQIQTIGSYYTNALAGMVREPSARYELQSLLTAEEKQQLLVEWNQTPNAEEIFKTSCDVCIHQLIENQVKQTPDAVAVVFANQQLTYHELNCRANQLAHYLQELGVKPEALVGICVERSLDMVVGILGILKAGGAYLPLDPAHPPERLTYILGDAQVSILLTQQKLAATLPTTAAQTICLDTGTESITQYSQNNPLKQATANNLAYLIYTSGSTGKPKGVQVPHRGVVNFLNSLLVSVAMTQQDVLLSVTTITFDIAALELFLPLIVGARTVVVSREVASDGVKLAASIAQYRTTFMQATPATWRMLLAARWQGNKQLKILCGGEALPAELANELQQRCACLWNVYGPTETTIWSTIYQVNQIGDRFTNIPIGRPIANTQTYILDNNLQPVPVGVIGELYIGGDGVTKGYLNRPELTKERFITNPFSDLPEARLYKTGDLARYCADGNIEFQGRSDYQVKIRGFRIELGEIEAVVSQHPDVREVVVLTREEKGGGTELVAYVVPNTQLADTKSIKSDLRRFLKAKLPDYMIPAVFVILEALPLTPNGKIDRRNLPEPDCDRELEVKFVAPRTPSEEILAFMWTEVLGVEQVGIYDNFFELGGHSLLAMQLVSRIRTTFNIELPLRNLFAAPTIAELAECIQQLHQDTLALSIPPIIPIPRNTDLPLSFAQQRLWFLDQLQEGNHTYNDPTAVRLTGSLNITALEQSLNAVVSRHETLRTVFTTVEGQPVQKIQPITDITIPIVDLRVNERSLQQRKAEGKRIALEEAQCPFNLAQGPLLRVMLLQLDEAEYVLLLTMHHIISDLWSMAILIRELANFYAAFCQGKSLTLPDLPIQYADFAVWQRKWMQGKVLETQLAYWKQQLQDAPTKLELPTDKPRPLQPTYAGTTQSFQLPKDLSDALKLLSKREDVTLYMTLLTTFNVLLYYYTKQEDILVGSPIANRNRSEIEGLIGFFVNSLVLRTDLSGNPSFTELLCRTREVTLGAYAHQDLPFEKLVGELQLERDLNYNPLFQVWFTLQNIATPDIQKLTLSLPGLTLTPFQTNRQISVFDLGIFLSEEAEGISGCFEYKTDLFKAETILHMAEELEMILRCVVSQPGIRLKQLVAKLNESNQQKQLIRDQEYKNTIYQKLIKIKQNSNRQ